MRRSLRIVLASALAIGACATARAAASASVEFTGPGTFDINLGTTRDYLPAEAPAHGFTLETAGAVFTMANLSVDLPRGGSADFFYDYTITGTTMACQRSEAGVFACP